MALTTINRRDFLIDLGTAAVCGISGCVALDHKVTVLYYAGVPEQLLIAKESDLYERTTNIALHFQPMEYNCMWEELMLSLDEHDVQHRRHSDSMYDVVFVDDIWLQQLAANHWLEDLSAFGKRSDDIRDIQTDYPTNLLLAEAYYPDNVDTGKIYLIPHRADVQVLFYNREIFGDSGVKRRYLERNRKELRVPGTWDEYATVARGINGINFEGERITGCAETLQSGHFAFEFFASRYWAMSTTDLFDSTFHPQFASEAGIRAVHHFKNLIDAGAATPNSLTADHGMTLDAFGGGLVALCPQWYTFVGDKRLIRMRDALGVTFLPGRHPCIGGGGLGIPANAKNKAAAWNFIRYFTGEDFCEKALRERAVVARSMPYLKVQQEPDDRGSGVYQLSLLDAKRRPRIPNYRAVESILGSAISQAIQSSYESTGQILQTAADACTEVIHSHGEFIKLTPHLSKCHKNRTPCAGQS